MPTAFVSNSFDPAKPGALDPATSALIARRQRALGPCYRLFYDHPVHFERAEGVWLYDTEGQKYLDAYNNVPSVGHCHPHVVAAINHQVATLNVHTRYLFDNVVTYAEKLLSTFPPELSNVMLTCSGSESTDLALRIARFVSHGEGIIVTRDAYHGTTAAGSEISPSRGDPGPNVRVVPAPDTYKAEGKDIGAQFADAVAAAIADMQRSGVKFAGLLVDSVFSSDGFYPGPKGFLKQAVEVARQAGGLFIADEVQAGFGRTGDFMWGFQRHSVVPDLVILGKPMGNGMPIGGVVAKPQLLTELGGKFRYFNTFGGNPVCCAAGLAVLEVIENEDLMANAQRVGNYMLDEMQKLASKYQAIGDVRGTGLFLGVEFVKDRKTKEPDSDTSLALVNAMREKRILINALGPYRNVLKIRPPLPFSMENARHLVSTMDAILHDM
jgi:4-aminobutyrate aminotransferase-like enzyme